MSGMVGITLGDPAGIGPEVTARALLELGDGAGNLVIVGSRKNFLHAVRRIGIPENRFEDLAFEDIPSGDFPMGKVSKEAGMVALRSIETAAVMAMEGRLEAICTAPISKEAILLAGSAYKDHTTMLRALTGSGELSTVFETGKLRTTFLTKHVSLKEAIDSITEDTVYKGIVQADLALRLLGINNGSVAVSALNPHGGEGGLFGKEEVDAIIPAVERAKEKFNVHGPYPADSVFHRASQGEFQMVLSLYHDQGHIATKMLDFHHTVSMNTGMPFLRTSVDHGTAFDIAGRYIASGQSMKEAIVKALDYSAPYRENYRKLVEKN